MADTLAVLGNEWKPLTRGRETCEVTDLRYHGLYAVGQPSGQPIISRAPYSSPGSASLSPSSWAVRPIRSRAARLALALGMIAMAYDARNGWGEQLASPGYVMWVYPTMLAALGWLLRLTFVQMPVTAAAPTWLGLFGGYCLASK